MAKLKNKLSPKQKVIFGNKSTFLLSALIIIAFSIQYYANKGDKLEENLSFVQAELEVNSSLAATKAEQKLEEATEQIDISETLEETLEETAETSTSNSQSARPSHQSNFTSIASPKSVVQTSSAASISNMEMKLGAYTGKLLWTSSYQRNIANFIIEKSVDDKAYKEIGSMEGEGKGEFSMKKSYEFEDTTLMYTQMPRLYYRLKKQGTQGDHDYSEVIEYDLGLSNGLYASVSLSPEKELQIQYAADKTGLIYYQILNAFGSPIMGAEIEADFDPQYLNIAATDWEKGTYYLKLNDEKYSYMEAFYIE